MGVQVTLHIAEDLYRRAERLARSRQREVADLLAESIHLPQTAENAAELADDDAIERETAAYRALHGDLLQYYEGQYIALHHGELVAHGPDFGAVYSEVNRAYPHEFVLIRRVETDPEPVYHFRSPRFAPES
ncbi:MAG: hypothetical protein IAE79_00280 [Anaerolinea sp.]|nr:hypothetical protein [Anaerolinea sp.]